MPPDGPISLIDRVLDGRYRVLRHLADGGMATVYVAVDERLDREVALKVMRADLAKDDSFVQRFHREARSAARLSHPNVVGVYDQGDDNGQVFLAMELVNGLTLRQVMDAEGPLTPRAALDIIDPVLQALGAAHSAGLIHRDVKPENVILRDDGTVKVADFGLARAIATNTATDQTGVLLGTVAYLSPEQVERGTADARSDVYAAGLMLFEMLTGTKAFIGDTAIHVAYQHVYSDAPMASSRVDTVPDELDRLIARASARDPDNRPLDANALLSEVRRARQSLTAAELDLRPRAAAATASNATMVIPRTEVVPGPTAAPGQAGSAAGSGGSGSGRDGSGGWESGRAGSGGSGSGGAGSPTAKSPLAGAGPTGTRWPLPRLQRGRRRTIALIALVLVLVAAAGLWFLTAGPGAKTTVPAVTGSTTQVAQRALAGADLDAVVVKSFDETVKAGTVVIADPPAGREVSRGSTVTLTVSRGPERYTVPTLIGRTEAEARQRVTDIRLTIGEVAEAYNETVPQGQVISTSPAAGASVKRATRVSLVISKGRQPIQLTDWTGKPADQAIAALREAKLTVDAAKKDWSDTVPEGSVISQSPATGTVFQGDTVTLVVSKGPELVPVPNVVGQQEDQATATLEDLGFQVEVRRALGGFFGTVRLQSIDPGTEAPSGSTIQLTVV